MYELDHLNEQNVEYFDDTAHCLLLISQNRGKPSKKHLGASKSKRKSPEATKQQKNQTPKQRKRPLSSKGKGIR